MPLHAFGAELFGAAPELFRHRQPNAEPGRTERRRRHVDIGKVERIIEIERIDERVPLRETEFVPAPELVPA